MSQADPEDISPAPSAPTPLFAEAVSEEAGRLCGELADLRGVAAAALVVYMSDIRNAHEEILTGLLGVLASSLDRLSGDAARLQGLADENAGGENV